MEFTISDQKIIYLLTAPGKAKFFLQIGYTEHHMQRLRADILNMVSSNVPVSRADTEFGKKFEITGVIVAPNGRNYRLRTGWVVLPSNTETLNFVTAYPAKLRQ